MKLQNNILFVLSYTYSYLWAMAKTKEITPQQYSWATGQSLSNVRNLLHGKKDDRLLPNRGIHRLDGVISIKHYARFYTFVVKWDMIVPESDPGIRRDNWTRRK